MGLDGDGGGGILGVGNTFTGPAQALEVMGDHAFAYSGVIDAGASSSADVTYLSFTSGNYYLVGTLQCSFSSSGGNDNFTEVTFNGSTIIKSTADAAPDMAYLMPFNIIIPPYTDVVVKWGIGNITVGCAWWIVGRIYRG